MTNYNLLTKIKTKKDLIGKLTNMIIKLQQYKFGYTKIMFHLIIASLLYSLLIS